MVARRASHRRGSGDKGVLPWRSSLLAFTVDLPSPPRPVASVGPLQLILRLLRATPERKR